MDEVNELPRGEVLLSNSEPMPGWWQIPRSWLLTFSLALMVTVGCDFLSVPSFERAAMDVLVGFLVVVLLEQHWFLPRALKAWEVDVTAPDAAFSAQDYRRAELGYRSLLPRYASRPRVAAWLFRMIARCKMSQGDYAGARRILIPLAAYRGLRDAKERFWVAHLLTCVAYQEGTLDLELPRCFEISPVLTHFVSAHRHFQNGRDAEGEAILSERLAEMKQQIPDEWMNHLLALRTGVEARPAA